MHDTKELIDAFNNIFQRRLRKVKPEKRAFSKIVGREKVSVDDMVEKICKVLKHINVYSLNHFLKRTIHGLK